MFPDRDRKSKRKVRIDRKLSDGNRRSKIKARTDGDKIRKIREGNRFFQSQKVKIRPASGQKYKT